MLPDAGPTTATCFTTWKRACSARWWWHESAHQDDGVSGRAGHRVRDRRTRGDAGCHAAAHGHDPHAHAPAPWAPAHIAIEHRHAGVSRIGGEAPRRARHGAV